MSLQSWDSGLKSFHKSNLDYIIGLLLLKKKINGTKGRRGDVSASDCSRAAPSALAPFQIQEGELVAKRDPLPVADDSGADDTDG